jgi:O-antigen/teichoic acid export membrane protein
VSAVATGNAALAAPPADRIWAPALLYLASRAIAAATGVIAVVAFIRLVGAAAFGEYSVIAALALLGGSIGATWLVQAILRYGVGSTAPPAVSRAAVSRGLLLSCAGVGVPLAAVLVSRGAPATTLVAALLAAWAILLYSVRFAERQAAGAPALVLVAELVRGTLLLAVPLALVVSGALPAVESLLLGTAIGNAAGSRVLQRGGAPAVAAVPAAELRAMLCSFAAFGGPLTLWMGGALLLSLSDRFVIEWLLGAARVGVYTALYETAYRSTGLLLAPILLAAHPPIMRAWTATSRPARPDSCAALCS